MEKNIGKTDKAIRFLLALVVAYLGYLYTPWLYIVAAILLITSFTGFCLLYKPFGISTVEKKKK
jgi:hypothetical protein